MLSLREINRVVFRLEWASPNEWIDGLDRLADLSEAELDEVVRLGPAEPTAGRP